MQHSALNITLMKSNQQQKAICEIISRHVTYWANSNDINSPTHQGDLFNELLEKQDELNITREGVSLLYDKIMDIHSIIKVII